MAGPGDRLFRTTQALKRFDYGPRAVSAAAVSYGGGYAPVDSPHFTGDPQAPTPAPGDNDTSIATTAFVAAEVNVPNDGQQYARVYDHWAVVTGGGGGGSGTVTSISAGTGIVVSPSPITTTGTVALSVPVSIANGGTGSTSAGAAVTALGAAPLNQAVTLTGDIAASGAQNTSIAATLATVNANVGTFQGITVNGKGLVTGAANQSYLTGNQAITLSGDLSGSGTTAINAQIAANAVGTPEIADGNVTYAKIQNVANNRILGNTSGSAAAPSEIVLPLPVANGGTGLASGTSGGVPYYSATGTIASSGALTVNRLVQGGGAGAAPVASSVEMGVGASAHIVTTGNGASTQDCAIELGGGRTGNGAAYIDLHAVTGTDYELRLQRLAGANGAAGLINTGNGGIAIDAATGAVTVSPALGVGSGGTGDTGTAWAAYTPTVTAGSGTLAAASATGRSKAIGKTRFVEIVVTITTNGTGASSVQATLPGGVTAVADGVLAGREKAIGGYALCGMLTATSGTVQIFKYDNSYPGGTGAVLVVSGVMEAT